MRGVPPEVDQLMWAVSENPEPSAISEFGERYPHLRAELMHRVNMVRSLRTQVRPGPQIRQELPRFQHREVMPTPNPRGIVFAGALTLAALAAASYTAYTALHPERPRPAASVRQVPTDLKFDPVTPPVIMHNPSTLPTAPPNEAVTPKASPRPPAAPAYLQPRARVAFKDENLTTALALITDGSGMQLEMGPGFVDQKITVDYRNMNTVEILKDMAAQYAFTIFDEGNGTYLALPVPDRTAHTTDQSKNSPLTK